MQTIGSKRNISALLFTLWLSLFSSLSLAANANINQEKSLDSAIPATSATDNVRDPYEHFNRKMFAFNETMDTYFLKPVATFYNLIIPRPLNQGIHNVFLNFSELPSIGNDLLQLHFLQFANDFWRLVINTTVGIGGLFDIASRIGLPYYANDFGLTLAYYGFRNPDYFVIPFYGPSTTRDTMAYPVDYFAFEIYPRIRNWRVRYGLYALGVVDRRAQLLQYQSFFEAAAIDKYAFVRNAALQHRAYQIQQNLQLGRANMPPSGVNK